MRKRQLSWHHMPQGVCKLCLQMSELLDSHFIPAAMYKYIRAPSLKNPNPTVVGRTRTITTSKQAKDYLLCSACEDLFNKNGENETLKWVCHDKEFRLGARLAVALPLRQSGDAIAFSGGALGIQTDKLGYFALSVIWRAAVHEWHTPLGKSTVLDLGRAEDTIRRYLLGETAFPAEAAIILSVCTDMYSQRAFFMPSPVLNFPGTCFILLTLGLHFMIFLGLESARLLRDVCCVRSATRTIYQRDCKKKTIEAYRDLVMSQQASKNNG